MRSTENAVAGPVLVNENRLSPLSIVVDDFDSAGEKEQKTTPIPEVSLYQPSPKPYTRQSSDASIRKILEEAEHRKHEFWKLLDEHRAVVENLKKIEQLESNLPVCKLP